MAFLRHSFGKYTLDLSEKELDAVTTAMGNIGVFTEDEKNIYHQLTKYRNYLKEEDKWHRAIDEERGIN
jgi:hypothetical protein